MRRPNSAPSNNAAPVNTIPPKSATPARKGPSGSAIYQWNVGDATNKTEADLIGMVKAVDVLVQDKAVGKERFNLMNSQITNYLALARLYRVRNPQNEKDKKNEQICLERAGKLSETLIQNKELDARFKARAWYFKGVSLIYQNRMDDAVKGFLESIKIDSNSDNVPVMSLFVAEYNFDKEKFKEAISDYSRFFNRFSKDQKVLAMYKMAWCYYRLQNSTKAIDFMIRLLSSKDVGSYAKDALDDLAMFTAKDMNENQLVDFAGTKFYSNRQMQFDYLFAVYSMLRAQSATKQYPILFSELMRLEGRIPQKMNLLVKNLHFEQRQYASRVTIKALRDVQSFLERSSVGPENEVFKANAESLESEVVILIKTYAETLSKKIISPENLSKVELTTVLKGLIEFHFRFFPQSKNKKFTTTVFVGLCHEAKDYVCVYQMSRRILTDTSMQELHANAKRDILVALDNIYKNSAELKAEYLTVVEAFLKDQPADKDWMRLGKKITAIYIEEKKYKDAIVWLEKIYQRERSSENLYRYELARYQNNQFQDIIKDPMPGGKDNFTIEIQKIYRDCYLKVAQQASEKNDLATYEGNIKAFLQSGADEKSSDVVRLDFFKKLLQQNSLDRLVVEYKGIHPKKWMEGGFVDISNKLISHFIKTGAFSELLQFLKQGTVFGKKPEIDTFWFTAIIGKPQPLTPSEQQRLNEIKSEIRNYFLEVLALTQPRFAQQFIKKNPGRNLQDDQKMMILALRMEQGRTDITIDKETLKYLGKSVPKEVVDREETAVEKKIEKIVFPSPTASEKEVEVATAKIVPKVQGIRQEVINEIKTRSPFAQTRILRKAMTLEDQTAQLILNAPLPAELKEELKIQEYKKQLDELALGFTQQSQEYRKILDKVLESTGVGVGTMSTIVPEPEKFPKMPPQHEATLERLIADGNFSGAFLFLDKLRADEDLNEELFYSGRARTLLKVSSGEFIVNYVLQELKAGNQEKMVQLFMAPALEVK